MATTPAKLRHLAALIRGEAAVEAAVNGAFRAWLPKVEAAVLANGQLHPSAATQADDEWNTQVENILAAIFLVWNSRHGLASSNNPDWIEYSKGIRGYLTAVHKDAFERVQRISRKNNLSISQRIALVRTALHPSQWTSKAGQIGRTQAVSAYNAGFNSGLLRRQQGSPVDSPKPDVMWLSVRDSRVRETHQIADGQVRKLGEAFNVGGFAAHYPGDPALPASEAAGCRCVLVESSPGILASVTTPSEPYSGAIPNGWRGIMAPLNVPTGDGRMLLTPADGVRTRDYPMSMTREHVSQGIDNFIGTIDFAWVHDGMLWGEGSFDTGNTEGYEAARQLTKGLNTVSIQPDEVTFEQKFIDSEGNFVEYDDAVEPETAEHGPSLRDGYQIVDVMSDWRLASVAIVSIPAFDQARIQPVYDYVPRAQGTMPCPMCAGTGSVPQDTSNMANHSINDGGYDDEYAADDSWMTGDPLIAAVTGNLDLPVAARKTKWDGHVARQTVAKWASSDGSGDLDKIDFAKFGQAFLYRGKPQSGNALYAAGDGGKGGLRVQDFKLGFATIINGKLTIVPNGAIGIAGGHGVTATKGISDAEKTQLKSKLCSLYGKIRASIPDFPACPFNKSAASVEPAIVAAVTGSTSLPVAPTSTTWDGPAAGGRILDAATTDGKINVAKASRGFMWHDGDGSLRGDYKFAFADIKNGTLTIIPRGVSAAAGRLNQAKGVDTAALKTKICSLYSKIQESDDSWPDCPFNKSAASVEPAIVAAVGQTFKREFFEDPKLDGPTPITITDDGRVFGHIALFGSCYQYGGGNGRECRMTPHNSDFDATFHLHGALLEDGSVLPVGALTFGEGHQDHGGLRAAQRAYANVASVAAKIRCGEDKFGVWMSGQMLDSFDGDPSVVMYAPLSGHWEPNPDNRGRLSMIAAHSVVTPGFRVPRLVAAFDSEGEVESFALAAPNHEDHALAEQCQNTRAVLALERMGLGPNARAKAALKRLGV